MKGSIKLFIGPMFAGKTSRMVADVERLHIGNKMCVIVSYAGDDRYADDAKNGGVVTHARREHHRVPIVRTANLTDVFDEISEYDVVGIDETQFYPDNVEVTQRLANMGKIVIAAGLDTDFKAKPFGRMPELISISEDVIKLKAVCMKCCGDASFTHRITNNDEIIDIGGADKYIAICRSCLWVVNP